MSLLPKTKQLLKARAHRLKPVVILGNKGLTTAVHQEIDRALHDHELIKIRVPIEDREIRHTLADEICHTNHAELVQMIGHIAIIYRKRPDK